MDFIKKNKYILCIILGVVAMALMIPNITRMFKQFQYYSQNGLEMPTASIFLLVEYICIFIAELVFVLIGYRRSMDKTLIITSVILYYASTGAYYVYEAFVENDFSYVFNLIISVLCIVTVVLALTNPRYMISAIILLLIDSAFNLSYTFIGSTSGFSSLILTIMLIFTVVLYKSSLREDTEFTIYS